MKFVVLCADSASLRNPALLGLGDESLDTQPWLKAFCVADEARAYLRGNAEVDEAWFVSSDDMDAINLAAAAKADNPHLRVYLVAAASGSLASRARAAGIDKVATLAEFDARYAANKRAYASSRYAAAAAPSAGCGTGNPNEVIDGAYYPPGYISNKQADARDRRYDSVQQPRGVSPSMRAPSAHSSQPMAPSSNRPHGKRAFLMPVVSGSGGAGKSTVAAMAACLSQAMGFRTLLLDADFQFGDMQEMMGAREVVRVDDLLANPGRTGMLVCQQGAPALLAAPERVEQAEVLEKSMGALLDIVEPAFDVIVVNTGSSWGEGHAVLLERASKALFLVDQRSSSLTATRKALDVCKRCGIATGPFLFVANRCSKQAVFTSIDLSCALQGARAVELADGGRSVEEYVGSGYARELSLVRNDLVESLSALLKSVLPERSGVLQVSADPVPAKQRASLRGFRKRKARRREVYA